MPNFKQDSPVFKGALTLIDLYGFLLPFEFSGPRSEYLACRKTAWPGVNLNNMVVYDVIGPDAGLLFKHGDVVRRAVPGE